MPNKSRRDKKFHPGSRHRASGPPGAHSVKSLLSRHGPVRTPGQGPAPAPVLASIADQASRQLVWRRWLGERLAAELLARITGIVESRSELVLFAESASWGARLRYALADLQAELAGAQPPIERVRVRVLPRGSGPAAAK